VTNHIYLLAIEGLFTQGWRTGRTVGESIGGIREMDSSGRAGFDTIHSRPDPTRSTDCDMSILNGRDLWIVLAASKDAIQLKKRGFIGTDG
jgi:hypothetical protein